MSQLETHLDDYGVMVERDLLRSRIVALFLQSALWGVFAVTYLLGAGGLLSRDQPGTLVKRNRSLLLANTAMFVLATVHVILAVYVAVYGFVEHGDTRDSIYNSLDLTLRAVSGKVDIAQYYIYVTQVLIGDTFMVYRMSVVWSGRRKVIIVPIVLFTIDIIVGYSNWLGSGNLFQAVAFYAFSFFTNMVASTLIMWRVLRTTQETHWHWHSRTWFNLISYRRVLEALIQSAAVYSFASIALVITSFLSPNVAYHACLSVFSPFIGVVFSLIVIQVARNSIVSNSANSTMQLSDSRKTPPRTYMDTTRNTSGEMSFA
ncbi:hypothetical protein C8Q74DRAFT_1373655 [Fomes fomentarius]|nr:hypothetical protein C8Q74DRAFT_1373655 [Fomes fomentarius]